MKDFNLNIKNMISLFTRDVKISSGQVKTKYFMKSSSRLEDLALTGEVMVVGITVTRNAGNIRGVGKMTVGKTAAAIRLPGKIK